MVLYENFNTTNQTSPHFESHESFVSDIRLPTCAIVATLPYDERCAYVEQTEQCHENIFIVDYVQLLYCQIAASNIYTTILSVCFLLFLCAALFIVLGLTADGFFCPSLTVVSRLLSLNENVAGVTLLAFGNGAPDIFTNLASMNGESERLYSNSYSAMLFVSFAVAGTVMTYAPFVAHPASFLRDLLFLLLSVVFIDFSIKQDHYISLFEILGLVLIYILYIFVVIMDQFLVKRTAKLLARKQLLGKRMSPDDETTLKEVSSQTSLSRRPTIAYARFDPSMHSYGSGTATQSPTTKELLNELYYSISPFNPIEWEMSNCVWRLFIVLKTPIQTFLLIFIPVIELEEKGHGWSKLLNCLQIILLPCLICFGTVGFDKVHGVLILYIVLAIATPISILLLLITRGNKPPKYHKLFSFLSIIGSIFMVYAVAQEITNILNVIGITTSFSDSFIGCTLLACGNSIGDLVTDIALSRQGYEKMAFAACFGGPLFNSVTCISTALIYKTAPTEDLKISFGEGTMGENATIFLMLGLMLLLFAAITTNFVLRRSMGIFMIMIYILFVFYIFLGELNIMHTYGTDHRMDLKAEPIE